MYLRLFEQVDTQVLYNIYKYNDLVIIIREFVWDDFFQIMLVINILTSFYHLKAKFNKLIIVFIIGAIGH